MRGYVQFLRRRHAARLLGGTLLGRLPNGMGMLAVVLHVRADDGGYPLAGTLSALLGLSTAAGQPVLGRAMDRYGPGRVLLPAHQAREAGIAAAFSIAPGPIALDELLDRTASRLVDLAATVTSLHVASRR